MNAPAILPELRAQGFKVWADAGRILVAPASRLTPDHRARIKAERAALVAALSETAEHEALIRRELVRIMGATHPDFAQALSIALAFPDALEILKRTASDAEVQR